MYAIRSYYAEAGLENPIPIPDGDGSLGTAHSILHGVQPSAQSERSPGGVGPWGVETDAMKKPKGDYAIQAVINAIRLLETFRDEEEQGVTPLAKRLDLHQNNVFRLLATLEQLGYIEQCAKSDRYRLGVRASGDYQLNERMSFAGGVSLIRHRDVV